MSAGGEGEGVVRHLFLCGADMDPTVARGAHPGARFVARARLEAGGSGGPGTEEVWGILLRVPVEEGEEPASADRIGAVVTDDGRAFEARLVGGGRPTGEPAAIVAAARYWELPPGYVERMRVALGGDEAPDE